MEAFLSQKRPRASPPPSDASERLPAEDQDLGEEDDTDLKLVTLASLYPDIDQATLLELLISADGSVDAVTKNVSTSNKDTSPRKRPLGAIGHQSSLSIFRNPKSETPDSPSAKRRALTRKGQTLHLYTPEDIAAHTPCSIIHNFLPPQQADDLLIELLEEASTFGRQTFKLFDNVVQSPHSACFYVDSLEEEKTQRTEYIYNGSFLDDVRQITPQMRLVSGIVQSAVNQEIAKRIKHFYPNGKKLKYQSPHEWIPNAAFVNCYAGGSESVGYHADQLTYLGPRAVIGSLSLGVTREFRVRKIVARDDDELADSKTQRGDAEGQISIHLPHNSLLIMHATTQEEYKHSIHPTPVIDPHPIAGNKRINVTYRYYRESFHPKYTPRCKCGVATVLRCVQRQKVNRGRYMWMCHAGYTAGKEGCSFFQWAEFDDDGEPPWAKK